MTCREEDGKLFILVDDDAIVVKPFEVGVVETAISTSADARATIGRKLGVPAL